MVSRRGDGGAIEYIFLFNTLPSRQERRMCAILDRGDYKKFFRKMTCALSFSSVCSRQ